MSAYTWLFCVIGTAICWGSYGIAIHSGNVNLGNPWKAFLLVGIAYFVIAVIVPVGILSTTKPEGAFQFTGGNFSAGTKAAALAGTLGALGALFVILAMKSAREHHGAGAVQYVMPLVFGMAPVVNAVVAGIMHPPKSIHWQFYAGLALLGAGAGLVMYYRPSH
ncbi:MAG: hypothetical protein AAF488_07385 [Planctomycetota bacterium]